MIYSYKDAKIEKKIMEEINIIKKIKFKIRIIKSPFTTETEIIFSRVLDVSKA